MSVGAVLMLGVASSLPLLAADNDGQAVLPLAYDRATSGNRSPAAGAERCPDERAVRGIFRGQLAGHTLLPGWKVRLGVAGGAGPSPEVQGHIELLDTDGSRQWGNELHAPPEECGTLVASLALSLRVFLGEADTRSPSAETGPDRHSPAVDGTESAGGSQAPIVIRGAYLPPQRASKKPAAPSPERSSAGRASGELDRSADHRVWASVAVVTGAAPRGATRFSLGYSFRWPWISFAVEARGIPPVTGQYSANLVRVARWESAIVPCLSEAVFFVCGLLSAGGQWVEVAGADPELRAGFRAGGGARAGAELALTSRLSLFAHIDIEGTFWPTVVHMTAVTTWREAAGQVALGIAVAGTFPGR